MEKIIILAVCALLLTGCPGPGSRAYAPEPGSYESSVFPKARRDIFPGDVRKQPKQYSSTLVLWTGIVRESELQKGVLQTKYEHHYWDWILDYGTQRQVAFLSPRGEGSFECIQKVTEHDVERPMNMPQKGEMAIVYGTPKRVTPQGAVVLECLPMTKGLPKELYATDIWDYGRSYLLNKDKNDFRVLRVPVFE